jgi:hypothetical protein
MFFTYYDSKSGHQNEKFYFLSALIAHIESFTPDPEEESEGIVYANNVQILSYHSRGLTLIWK